jgi:hypothetical protein
MGAWSEKCAQIFAAGRESQTRVQLGGLQGQFPLRLWGLGGDEGFRRDPHGIEVLNLVRQDGSG